MDKYITEGDVERFWSKVDKQPGATACWLWRGQGRVGWGYGTLRIGRDRAATTSNRAAWRILIGPIKRGLCVLHRCDNPLCVRPEHLFLGTRSQNAADRTAKNRQAKGTTLPQAKLDEQKVVAIRSRYAAGEHPANLAGEFQISLRGCWLVIQRRNWGWVCLPGEEAMSPSNPNAPERRRGYPERRRVYSKS